MIHGLRRAYEGLPYGVRSLVVGAVRVLPVQVRYGQAFVSERRLIAATERDQSSTEAVVEKRLAAVVDTCRRSPFWSARVPAALLSRESWRVRDLVDLEPIDKEIVRSHCDEMRDTKMASRSMRYVTTGGTSGRQVGFWLDRDASLRDWAYVVEAWGRVGFQLDSRRAVFRGVRLDRGGRRPLSLYEPIRRELYISTFDMSPANMPELMDIIDTFGARFIHGYPSAMETVGRAYCEAGRTPPALQALLAVSENLYPDQRKALEDMFGARVFSIYGLSERCCFAAECEHGTALHVAETYGIVELLAADGSVITEPGVRGEIVATGLISTGMPLIRYRTGDYASWAGGQCACGRVGRRLTQVEGRWEREFLVSGQGHRIYMTSMNMHSRGLDTVARFRFVQEAPGRATLLLEPGLGYTPAAAEMILREVQGKLEGQVHVTLDVTELIPLSPRGKHVFIDQRIPIDELP